MNSQEDVKDFIENGHNVYLRHLSIDCVIFGYHEHQLKVLLLKWKGRYWSLAGGFIKREEPLQEAAAGMANVTFAFPPNANHVFKEDTRGAAEAAGAPGTGYNEPGTRLDPESLQTILAWLRGVLT